MGSRNRGHRKYNETPRFARMDHIAAQKKAPESGDDCALIKALLINSMNVESSSRVGDLLIILSE